MDYANPFSWMDHFRLETTTYRNTCCCLAIAMAVKADPLLSTYMMNPKDNQGSRAKRKWCPLVVTSETNKLSWPMDGRTFVIIKPNYWKNVYHSRSEYVSWTTAYTQLSNFYLAVRSVNFCKHTLTVLFSLYPGFKNNYARCIAVYTLLCISGLINELYTLWTR